MKTKSKKKEKEKEKIKKTKLFELSISRTELIHLRDMLSILFPSTDEKTVSQALAASEQRTFEESTLWKKIATLCVDAGVPIDDEAPDYAVIPIGHAPMSIFMLGQDEDQQTKLPFLKEQTASSSADNSEDE